MGKSKPNGLHYCLGHVEIHVKSPHQCFALTGVRLTGNGQTGMRRFGFRKLPPNDQVINMINMSSVTNVGLV